MNPGFAHGMRGTLSTDYHMVRVCELGGLVESPVPSLCDIKKLYAICVVSSLHCVAEPWRENGLTFVHGPMLQYLTFFILCVLATMKISFTPPPPPPNNLQNTPKSLKNCNTAQIRLYFIGGRGSPPLISGSPLQFWHLAFALSGAISWNEHWS